MYVLNSVETVRSQLVKVVVLTSSPINESSPYCNADWLFVLLL